MSRVFKSECVKIGSPKAIDNVININVKKHCDNIENVHIPVDKNHSIEQSKVNTEQIIEEAKQLYSRIIQEANEEARRIIEEAKAQAEAAKTAAIEAGYNEGYNTGYSEGRASANEIIVQAAEIRNFLDSRKEEIFKEIEEEVLDLVLQISKKVIGDEITQNKDAILNIIRQGLNKCAFKNKLIIRVSSQDFEYANLNKQRIASLVEGLSEIEIYSDVSLKSGSCVIETPSGEIDSSVETQISEIEKAFIFMLKVSD